MVTFGIPSQFLRRPNKARGVSTIHGSNDHTSAMVPTIEATLTTGLLFFPTQSTRGGPTGQNTSQTTKRGLFLPA